MSSKIIRTTVHYLSDLDSFNIVNLNAFLDNTNMSVKDIKTFRYGTTQYPPTILQGTTYYGHTCRSYTRIDTIIFIIIF